MPKKKAKKNQKKTCKLPPNKTALVRDPLSFVQSSAQIDDTEPKASSEVSSKTIPLPFYRWGGIPMAMAFAVGGIPIHPTEILNGRFVEYKERTVTPQSNGKEICKKLREARIAFAKENGIDFHPAECHSDEPCPGTCPQCDSELEYLKAEAKKKNVVIYPQMEISSLSGK